MESSSIQAPDYTGALSVGLADLCKGETDYNLEFLMTDEVDFAIIINNLQ
jgi:hypothetical protein